MAQDFSAERERALRDAIRLYEVDALFAARAQEFGPGSATRELLHSATDIYEWLTGAVQIRIVYIGEVRKQDGTPTGRFPEGFPMQLHDDEQVTLAVAVTDAKGAQIADDPTSDADNITWSFDDPQVATLQVSEDTRSCTVVAGMPGSGVGTVSLGSLSATFAVDVVAGDAALLTVSADTPVKQTTAPADSTETPAQG